ncbi:MAG: hypothetical protein ACP5QO_06765 [Clostridia bacterium]
MPHGFRRADYWLYPWQIRAIQRLAESAHSTPSAVVRELLTSALPLSLQPAAPSVLAPDLVDGSAPAEPIGPGSS